MDNAALRYLIDPYLDWCRGEGVPIHDDFGVDALACETGPWPRLGDGCKGAIINVKGRGDYISVFIMDLPAGGKSSPQRHLYEEIFYVLSGHGSMTVEVSGGHRHSFEFGPRAMFAPPLNARYQIFNASGSEPLRLASCNDFVLTMNLLHSEKFIFNCDESFPEREGPPGYFSGEGEMTSIRPGRNIWDTNFVTDVGAFELRPWEERGAGSSNMQFILSDGALGAHTSEMPVGTYKKGHFHGAGAHIFLVHGTGYSLLWYAKDKDFVRIDWRHGMIFAPPENMFHQHFVTSATPARYLAIAMGSKRYPVVYARRSGSENERSDVSVKLGGKQIEYEDQDPRIHSLWLAEIAKTGATSKMGHIFDESRPGNRKAMKKARSPKRAKAAKKAAKSLKGKVKTAKRKK
jgi:mannose-6-phosphate isomerase-like protein (cupin superfamily)